MAEKKTTAKSVPDEDLSPAAEFSTYKKVKDEDGHSGVQVEQTLGQATEGKALEGGES